jgi:GntR family transcriptional repressor for pyruvate dehydrogenase complex
LKELDHICAEFSEKAKTSTIPALIAIDEQFHYAVAKSTKNKTLSILMKTMTKSLPVGWISSLHVPGRVEKTIIEHCAIVDAIRNHNPDKAEQLMIDHLNNARNEIMELIERGIM